MRYESQLGFGIVLLILFIYSTRTGNSLIDICDIRQSFLTQMNYRMCR